MYSQSILALVSLNNNYSDCSGHIYPESGYIKANDFVRDQSILSGLYGIAWGRYQSTKWLNPHINAKWKVVKVYKNDNIIMLDQRESFIKFKEGEILFSDSKKMCKEYIDSFIQQNNFTDKDLNTYMLSA